MRRYENIGPRAQLHDASALGLAQTLTQEHSVLAVDWWSSFGDPQLDQLVDLALTENPHLKVAAARVVRAQAGIQVARSDDWPWINAQSSLNRQKFSSNYIYPPTLERFYSEHAQPAASSWMGA